MTSKETIQQGFPIKPLGDVAEFLDSRRRPITASERIPGPYPYYGANGQQDSVKDYIFDEPLVLLAEDGGLFDQPDRGIAYAIAGKAWVNNHAHVLRPREHVHLQYLVRVLENYDVNPWITGSTRAKLTKAGASKIQIPIPPLAEQKRIAAILDAADALRAKRRESLAQLDTLLQSTFLDVFGDPVTNPMGWEVRQLAEVVETGTIVTYGIVQAGEEYPGGVPYIRTGDLVDGEIRLDELRHTDPAIAAKFERSRVCAGEIVMSIRATVGTTARVPSQLDGANLTQGTARISPGENTEPSFLLYFIRSQGSQAWLQRQVKGATFREITLKRFRQMPINVPPLDLQRRFAATVESLEQQKARQRAHLAELDTLFASLQQRAFRGKL